MASLLDSWPWKIAIALVMIAARELARRFPIGDPRSENRRALVETIDSAVITIGLVLFVIQPFILQAFQIPSGSMENTLKVSDRILVSKFVYRVRPPQRGDAIVFRAPPPAHPDSPDDTWIKRCIGTPGDIVAITGHTLFVNQRVVPQPFMYWDNEHFASYDMKIVGGVVYARERTYATSPGQWTQDSVLVDEPLQSQLDTMASEPIPPGKLLMLGDHRNNSRDGHMWGLLDADRVVGKAVCVFWPPAHWGTLDKLSEPSATTSPSADAIAVSGEQAP